MTTAIPEQLLARFSEFAAARFGLHFPPKLRRDLTRKIIAAARTFGFADAGACIEWLLSAPLTRDQLDTLASHLTIGETYFFREKKSFDLLETDILPALIAARRGREQRLRIWSAGCSTGEEAYSLAILLNKMIADVASWNITILATDINAAALGKAATGIYSDWSFRGVPRWLKDKYFRADGTGGFALSNAIKRMVTFAPLNLATDGYPSLLNNTNAMDLIFCRNVLMYLTPHQVEQIVEKFRHALVEGGWLAVSPCESSHTLFTQFETASFQDAVFYRKGSSSKTANVPYTSVPATVPLSPPPDFVERTLPQPPPMQPETIATAATTEHCASRESSPYEEALALYRQGEYISAAAKLAGLLTDDRQETASPSYVEIATLLARACANQGNFTKALEWSERAVAADRLNPHPYYLQANIFQEQGEIEAAIISLKKALYLDQGFVLAHFALANLTLRRGKTKEAARHLENAASSLQAYGADDTLPGSEGMNARRLAEIIAATRGSIVKEHHHGS
jgi:chemotaxis protein methyltransferase CheR